MMVMGVRTPGCVLTPGVILLSDLTSENNVFTTAYVGTTALVPCAQPLPVSLPVTWLFLGSALKASPKYTITSNSTLLVNNVSLSDDGLYQCVVGGATALKRRLTVIG